MKIIIGTHNKDKFKELVNAFKNIDKSINFLSLDDFPDVGEIEEGGKTLKENALIKARAVNSITGLSALSDDTGLEVDALHGAPGVYTARYAGENCSYSDNVNKLLKEMETVPMPNRTAQFKTVISYVDKDFELTAEGCVDGLISRASFGENGFGYDPIFFIPKIKMTFAQMTTKEKEAHSHRGKAIISMMDLLIPHLDNLSKKTKKEMA